MTTGYSKVLYRTELLMLGFIHRRNNLLHRRYPIVARFALLLFTFGRLLIYKQGVEVAVEVIFKLFKLSWVFVAIPGEVRLWSLVYLLQPGSQVGFKPCL